MIHARVSVIRTKPKQRVNLNLKRKLRHVAESDTDWQSKAACKNMSIDMFFPEQEPTDKKTEHYIPAKKICAICPVRNECLMYAMRMEEDERWRYGLYGGLTPHERWLYDPNYRLGIRHK